MTEREFIVRLKAQSDRDPIRALRGLLKIAWRRFELRCTDIKEVSKPSPGKGGAP